jgi:hypothetical protein
MSNSNSVIASEAKQSYSTNRKSNILGGHCEQSEAIALIDLNAA